MESPSIGPTASTGTNQTLTTGDTVTLNGSASTDNIGIESNVWDFDASDGLQQDATGVVVQHTYNTAGTYTATLTVTDADSNADSDTVTLTVINTEDPQNTTEPTTISIVPSTQTIAPGETFTANISIDPVVPITGAQFDLTSESSSVSIDDVTEGDLFKQAGTTLFNAGTIDNSAGEVSDIFITILGETYVFGEGVMATVNMTASSATGYTQLDLSDVIISDPDSNSVAVNTSNVTILVDTAPVLSSISDQSVIEESVLGFTVSGSDVDGDNLIYSATYLPNGASFDTSTGEFSWTPTDDQAGNYNATFEVTDGYLNDSATATITVIPLNHAPEISELVPSDGGTFDETESISIEASAFDEDGDTLSYIIKIDGVTCSTSSSYVWNTDYSSAGTHTIEVIVSDGIESTSVQHSIIINDVHPRWDVNEDGKVNILDINLIAQQYGNTVSTPYPCWDVNQDGVINIQDLTITAYHFGEIVE